MRWTDATKPNPDCCAARGLGQQSRLHSGEVGSSKGGSVASLEPCGSRPRGGGFPPLIERLQSDATRALSRSVPSAPDGTAASRQWPRAFRARWKHHRAPPFRSCEGNAHRFPACLWGKKLANAVLYVYPHSIPRDHEESSPTQDFALRRGNLISGQALKGEGEHLRQPLRCHPSQMSRRRWRSPRATSC